MSAIIYAGSHRKGGNSDRAAQLLLQGIKEADGEGEIRYLRDNVILPCLACGFCDDALGYEGQDRCVLGHNDQAWSLFAPMLTARTILFASPIYFYNLPSMLKTWIDRGQQFWKAYMDKEPWLAELPKRTAHAVLIAGQPTGEKLFDGARLTLKYFVQNFNIELTDPLTFKGIDQSGDLTRKKDFEAQIIDLGKRAWNESA